MKCSKFDKTFLLMKDVLREHIKLHIDDADDKTVEKVFKIMEGEDGDLLENLSAEQEASLIRGIKDADEGRTIPHEEVIKKFSKWLTK